MRGGRRIPYVLLIPGMLFTFVFFVVPLITLLKISLSTKPDRLLPNYDFTWEWSNFATAFTTSASSSCARSSTPAIATVLCLLIAYPIAYFIAFKAGALAQHPARARDGAVLHQLPAAHDRLAVAAQRQRTGARRDRRACASRTSSTASALLDDGRLLNTQVAVIGGLTYNFLPFMLLPIYVSLEKIDIRLVDAASDLYSSFARTFRKVILPLSLPGVFAGTLLTFIPAADRARSERVVGGGDSGPVDPGVHQTYIKRGIPAVPSPRCNAGQSSSDASSRRRRLPRAAMARRGSGHGYSLLAPKGAVGSSSKALAQVHRRGAWAL